MKISKYILFFVTALAFMVSCSDKKSAPSDPGWNDGKDDGTTKNGVITLMSYNTRHCAPYDPENSNTVSNPAGIAAVISTKYPDVVFLQEMDKNNTRSNGLDEPKELAARAKYPYYEFFKIMDYKSGEYGLAMLSKYPLISPQTHQLPSQIDNVTITSNNAVGSATINVNGTNIFLVCVHLSLIASESKAQLKYVIENIIPASMPAIIGGDYNSRPTSETIALLDNAGFKRTNENSLNYTIPSNNPNREIDYIAYRPADSWTVNSHLVITGTQASDHLPIVASLKLNK